MPRVTFLPLNSSTDVPAGTLLTAAAEKAGVRLDAPCGGQGTCGKCLVRVQRGQSSIDASSRRFLSTEQIEQGWRLGCRTVVVCDLLVDVPESAADSKRKAALKDEVDVLLQPRVRKIAVTLSTPSLQDQRSEATRLREELICDSPVASIGLSALRDLRAALAEGKRTVTVVVVGDDVVMVEPGDTSATCFGVAFDIGTTTVVGTLLDLLTGAPVAVASELNGQTVFGADVVSRLQVVISEKDGLQRLNAAVLATINSVLSTLTRSAGISPANIYEMVVVGNTCMQHLAEGVDATGLAYSPYVPTVQDLVMAPAHDFGIAVHPAAPVTFAPNIAGFVGGDTVGVVLATGLHKSDRLRMAIDIGTNGEIVLGSRGRMVACSCAGGPAFEGARIRSGMRAVRGAIESAHIEDGELHVGVVDGGSPSGICGSGLVDVVGELLRAGIMDDSGRILSASELGDQLPASLLEHVVPGDHGQSIVLGHDRNGKPVLLTQRDVRELQLAKGAMLAGAVILMERLGVTAEDIEELLLAGAFGTYVSRESARMIGLIPPLPLDRIVSVGNAASTGAKMALLSTVERAEMMSIPRSVEHIELFNHPGFQNLYIDCMGFPTPELRATWR